MAAHVCLEVICICAGIIALFANKRLQSTVNQHVDFQMRSFVACVAALVGTVGVLSIVLRHLWFDSLGHLQLEIAMN